MSSVLKVAVSIYQAFLCTQILWASTHRASRPHGRATARDRAIAQLSRSNCWNVVFSNKVDPKHVYIVGKLFLMRF